MSILIKPAYDADASTYFTTAGVTSVAGRQQISRFVTGIKDLGLWSSMVCWPLRSSQNAGTGTTAYSLGGLTTANGTLVNGPTWGVDGITFTSGSSQSITIPNISPSQTDLMLASCHAATSGNLRSVDFVAPNVVNTGFWSPFGGQYYWDCRSTAGSLNRLFGGTISPTTSRTFIHGIASASGSTFFVNGTSSMSNSTSSTNGNMTGFTINFNGGNGNIAFTMFSQSITGNASLYTLYKNTLGQGLGLP